MRRAPWASCPRLPSRRVSTSDQGWTVMGLSIAVICGLLLALVYVPGFRPSDDALACDGEGGYWSSEEAVCHKSDSPAAGMAS